MGSLCRLQIWARHYAQPDAVIDAGRAVMNDGAIQERIVELNREQMMRGKNKSGENIMPSYRSSAYAAYKQGKNAMPEFGVPDLKNTGAFHRGIYFDSGKMTPTSNDPKTASLEEKYGEGIFGLNKDSLTELVPDFRCKMKEVMSINY